MLENFLTKTESPLGTDCNWTSQKIQIPMAVLSWGNVDGASSKTRVPCVVIWWKAGANHRRPDNYSFSTNKKGKQNSRRWKSGSWLLLLLKLLLDPKQLELRSTGHRFAHLSISPLWSSSHFVLLTKLGVMSARMLHPGPLQSRAFRPLLEDGAHQNNGNENGYCTWWKKSRSFIRNKKHIIAPGEKDYNVSFICEQKLSPYTLFTLVSKSQSE